MRVLQRVFIVGNLKLLLIISSLFIKNDVNHEAEGIDEKQPNEEKIFSIFFLFPSTLIVLQAS